MEKWIEQRKIKVEGGRERERYREEKEINESIFWADYIYGFWTENGCCTNRYKFQFPNNRKLSYRM